MLGHMNTDGWRVSHAGRRIIEMGITSKIDGDFNNHPPTPR